ncbi:MAG: T9SS type A sorting domain-containing protein [Prevotellaceae bacterium]|jgi:hypothetical protein|nr:T9SS type A sorting domain-containing protein [Prevotellaceae bacterium]
MKPLFLIFSTIFPLSLFAQFDGIVGSVGCKAIHVDDARFVEWASDCEIMRGYQDIARKQLGFVFFGDAESAIGKASKTTTEAVSLGDGGTAVLTFQTPIVNGEGADFAVFENSFSDAFLELAFVEISSDGEHYFRFPATSNTQTETQVTSSGLIDATKINNLAGKYRIGWGTPFDLEELPENENLDKNDVTHVKIIDVVGTINPEFASHDSENNIINDPYPTAFAGYGSGGFDLTGIGVIHNQNNLAVKEIEQPRIFIYNNGVELKIENAKLNIENVEIFDISGKKLNNFQFSIFNFQLKIDISALPKGVYLIKTGNFAEKFVK